MNYFSDFFAMLITFAVLLYVALVVIDGICGLRDFFIYRTFLGEGRKRERGKWL